jgi:hypothetical protein
MHNRKAITPMRLWESLTDYDLWPVSSHVVRRRKQTDSSADLCPGFDCLYSTISSWYILNSHSSGVWLQPSKTSTQSLLPSFGFPTRQHSSLQIFSLFPTLSLEYLHYLVSRVSVNSWVSVHLSLCYNHSGTSLASSLCESGKAL